MFDEGEPDGTSSESGTGTRRGLDFGAHRPKENKNAARAVRIRIFTLMVLLLVVIIAMKEAGKPERWMWMGFDKVDQGPQPGDFLVDASSAHGKDGSPDEMDWALAKSASSPVAKSPSAKGDETTTPPKAIASNNELEKEFWQGVYKRLSEQKQLQLFGLLRKVVRADIPAPKEPGPLKKIIQRLDKDQNDFQTLLLSELSLLSDQEEKKQKTESLFAFDQRWQQEIMPTLNAAVAGDDYTFAGQTEIKKVVQLLRPLYMDAVEDLARIGNPSDVPGFMTIWDEVMAGPIRSSSTPSSSDATEVSFLQLTGQSDSYRGKPVSIKGLAGPCKLKVLRETQLPVDHYYEVWIDTVDSDGDGVFCVYAADIPDSFPRSQIAETPDKFYEVNLPVSLTGRFFKVRPYNDLGRQVSHSPVVIARKITAVSQASEVAAVKSLPDARFSAIWILGIAVVAVGLAIAIFRSSRTGARQLGRSSADRMQRTFEMLEKDPDVKSPEQNVLDLGDAEDISSDGDTKQETDQ